MDRPDYRKEYLERSSSDEVERSTESAVTSATAVPALLARLGDRDQERKMRLDALSKLQTLSFAVEQFRPSLPDYLELLRAVSTEPDRVLRARALEILALRRDEYAQRLLLDGLQGRATPLVPRRKALKLLGYDQHAAPRELLVELVDSSDAVIRRRALRQLAADGESAPIFERIASDPEEDDKSRQIGLTALQSLQPEKFGELARRLAVDERVDDDLRAASLTALAEERRVGGAIEIDEDLREAVRETRDKTRSRRLTRAADNFLDAASPSPTDD